MIVRTCVAAGTYASFVSLLSLGGSWGLPLAAAPFASVEAPGTARPVTHSPWLPASAGRPSEQPERFRLKAEVTYAERGDQVTLPVRAARIERRDASRGVENAVAALGAGLRGTAWLAWTVPAVDGRRNDTNRWDGHRPRNGECVLDEDGHVEHGSAMDSGTTRLVVLGRLQDGAIDRVTFADARCTVQAGSRTVYWLEGVRPADSVTWAARLIEEEAGLKAGATNLQPQPEPDSARPGSGGDPRGAGPDPRGTGHDSRGAGPDPRGTGRDSRGAGLDPRGTGRDSRGAGLQAGRDPVHDHGRVRSTALALIALTADPSADRVLEDFTAPSRPAELRRDAAFWLGAARGAPGAALVDRLARSDRDERFREHLMFVLTLTGERGIERLLDHARHDASPAVRAQALFWLAQKAGERAVATLARAVDSDPEVEVRTRAVFAISQLPKDEAVPRLIALAESHRDREVRQQAMFWLGQSGDPRALTFFEQVLRR